MGFVFGTLCLVGLALLLFGGRRRRWRRHHHHSGRGRCGGHGSRRGRDREEEADGERYEGRGAGWHGDGFLHVAQQGLNLREEQVGFVESALKDARKAVDNFAADLRESREDLASAVTGDAVDDARLAAVFAWHDDSLRQVRQDVVEAVKKVHAALDPAQRAKLTTLFDSGAGRWL